MSIISDSTLRNYKTMWDTELSKVMAVQPDIEGQRLMEVLCRTIQPEQGTDVYKAFVWGGPPQLKQITTDTATSRRANVAQEGMSYQEVTVVPEKWGVFVEVDEDIVGSRLGPAVAEQIGLLGVRAQNLKPKTLVETYLNNATGTTYGSSITQEALIADTHSWESMVIDNKGTFTVSSATNPTTDEVKTAIGGGLKLFRAMKDVKGEYMWNHADWSKFCVITDTNSEFRAAEIMAASGGANDPTRGLGWLSKLDFITRPDTTVASDDTMYIVAKDMNFKPFLFAQDPRYPKTSVTFDEETRKYRYFYIDRFGFAYGHPAGIVGLY